MVALEVGTGVTEPQNMHSTSSAFSTLRSAIIIIGLSKLFVWSWRVDKDLYATLRVPSMSEPRGKLGETFRRLVGRAW